MPLVYVVDDEANIRRLAKLALTDSGMQVETYASGVEFLQAVLFLPAALRHPAI